MLGRVGIPSTLHALHHVSPAIPPPTVLQHPQVPRRSRRRPPGPFGPAAPQGPPLRDRDGRPALPPPACGGNGPGVRPAPRPGAGGTRDEGVCVWSLGVYAMQWGIGIGKLRISALDICCRPRLLSSRFTPLTPFLFLLISWQMTHTHTRWPAPTWLFWCTASSTLPSPGRTWRPGSSATTNTTQGAAGGRHTGA